jgi:hypothetical protein
MIVKIEIANGIEIVIVTGIATATAIEIVIVKRTGTATTLANPATISKKIQGSSKRRQTKDFLIRIKNCKYAS